MANDPEPKNLLPNSYHIHRTRDETLVDGDGNPHVLVSGYQVDGFDCDVGLRIERSRLAERDRGHRLSVFASGANFDYELDGNGPRANVNGNALFTIDGELEQRWVLAALADALGYDLAERPSLDLQADARPKGALAEAIAKLEARRQRPSITQADLDRWFTYHPPTADVVEHYKAIRMGEVACNKVVDSLIRAYREHPEAASLPEQRSRSHTGVNVVLRAFASTVLEHAPDSADRTASIRAIRLARNALNEAIAADFSYPDGDAARSFMFERATVALLDARWQACAAVACGGPDIVASLSSL